MEGAAGRDLGRSSNKVTRKAADRGLLPQRALSLKTKERPREWAEVRWPVQVGEALPAPGSASVPSSCGETRKESEEVSRSGEVV